MTHTHHSVGQPFAVLVGEPLPAAFLESTVELLQVVLCQFIQRDVPNLRDDVQADAALIGLLRSWADLRLGVILVPVGQPVPEGHLRPHFFGLQPAAFLLELLEFFKALLLRFSENIFRLGVAVIIVTDDDTSFPASVLALADEPVAVRPFPCHVSHFLCNTNTYHNAFGISSENRTLFLVVVAPHDFLQRDLSSRATDVVDRLTAHLLELVTTEH